MTNPVTRIQKLKGIRELEIKRQDVLNWVGRVGYSYGAWENVGDIVIYPLGWVVSPLFLEFHICTHWRGLLGQYKTL